MPDDLQRRIDAALAANPRAQTYLRHRPLRTDGPNTREGWHHEQEMRRRQAEREAEAREESTMRAFSRILADELERRGFFGRYGYA